MTVAPASASARQCSRPSRPAAPVTTATRPTSEKPDAGSLSVGTAGSSRTGGFGRRLKLLVWRKIGSTGVPRSDSSNVPRPTTWRNAASASR